MNNNAKPNEIYRYQDHTKAFQCLKCRYFEDLKRLSLFSFFFILNEKKPDIQYIDDTFLVAKMFFFLNYLDY